jgi:hypothetical protein
MSTLKINTLSNLAGSQSTPVENAINGSAKAWVNFNGTGTVAIRASYNVSSITDLGTGYYQYNFANALADANYCVVAHHSQNGNSNPNNVIVGQELFYTTSSFRTNVNGGTGGATDFTHVFAAVFR